jgi:phage virion morphogenesis protein
VADLSVLESLYKALSSGERRKLMRSVIIAVRREQLQRIAAQRDPDGNPFAPRAKPHQGRKDQRTGPLFRRLRLIRHTTISASETQGVMGFKSRAERIAAVHQFGGMDSPRKGWRPVRYPERRLLGVSDQTERIVLEAVEKHLLK